MSRAIKRVVLVGAGLAAISTCDALRAAGYDGELVLVSAEDALPYDRPPLSKDVLLGKSQRPDILLRPAEWYAKQHIDLKTGIAACALYPAEHAIELADGTRLHADRIVLATGGTPRTLPVPGGDDPAAHLLRTWQDAETLRQRLLPGARIAVIGAGLIGAETAAAAAQLGCQVTLVDPLAAPLAGVVGPEVAEALHRRHAERGIKTVCGQVERIERRPAAQEARVHIAGRAEPVTADTVVVGIGIRPDTGLAQAAGLPVDNGILVDDRQQTAHPDILAIGDAARRADHPVRHEHWEAAQHDGQAAAATLLGRPSPAQRATWFWSDRHGMRLEAVGTMAEAERTVRRGDPGTGAFTVFGLRGNRLVAAAGIDRVREIQAARRVIDWAIPVDAAYLADQSADLRALVKGAR